MKFNNPKTTILGVLMILGALITAGTALLNGQHIDFSVIGGQIVSGVALIHAADGGK